MTINKHQQPSADEQRAEHTRALYARVDALFDRAIANPTAVSESELLSAEGEAAFAGPRPGELESVPDTAQARIELAVSKSRRASAIQQIRATWRQQHLDAKHAAKLAEDEQRIAALTVAEKARVKTMLRSGFVGSSAEFEAGFPALWKAYRDDEALRSVRGVQDAIVERKRREYGSF